jgi:diguanylate cyclase
MFEEAVSRARAMSPLPAMNAAFSDALSRIALWMTNTLNCVPDGLLATNDCGDVLFMNSRAEQLTGWTVEQALQRCSSDVFHLLDADSGTRLDSPLREAYIEEQIFRSDNCLLAAAHGDRMRIAYTAAPIRTEEGEVVGAVVVFREQAAGI